MRAWNHDFEYRPDIISDSAFIQTKEYIDAKILATIMDLYIFYNRLGISVHFINSGGS